MLTIRPVEAQKRQYGCALNAAQAFLCKSGDFVLHLDPAHRLFSRNLQDFTVEDYSDEGMEEDVLVELTNHEGTVYSSQVIKHTTIHAIFMEV